MKKQKLLSLACAAALIATAFSTGVIKTKADDTVDPIKEFGKADSYVDFSNYKARYEDGVATNVGGNNAGAAVDIVTVTGNEDVTGATGSKVAKIYQPGAVEGDRFKNTTWAKYAFLRVTENGGVNTATRLTAGETYRIELRYKLNKLQWSETKSANVGFAVGFTDNVALINFYGNSQNAQAFYADADGNQAHTNAGAAAEDYSEINGLNTWQDPSPLWTEATKKDENGWVTAKLNFTVPNYTGANGNSIAIKDTYIGLVNTSTGLAFTTQLEMYIDYVKINHISPVTIIDGSETTTNYIIPGESMAELAKSEEKYETESSKATVVETKYYSDEACTESVDVKNGVYGINTTLYKKSGVAVVDTENQAAFCGFDTYTLRTKPDDVNLINESKNFYFYKNGGALGSDKSFSITEADSHTGNKALLYNFKNSDETHKAGPEIRKAVYIGNGYDLVPGKTYELSFWYKPVAGTNEADTVTFKFKSGVAWFGGAEVQSCGEYKVDGLMSQTDWKQVKLVWTCETDSVPDHALQQFLDGKDNYTAPILRLATGDERTALYIDTMVISEVTSNEGAAMLESNKLDNGKQAIRFLFSYDTVLGKDNTVKLGSGEYTVKERGILVKSAANDASKLERGTEDARVIKTVKTNDFDTCWKYEDATGKYQFSMYIKGLAEDDTRELISRGYVVLADADGVETVFYSEENTTSLAKIAAGQPTA